MISIPNADDGESGESDVIMLIWIQDESESGAMKVKV